MPDLTAVYTTLNGSTRKVARWAMERIAPDVEARDLTQVRYPDCLVESTNLILFCPTYGDEELPAPIDALTARFDVAPRRYVICEAGNYYGYDAASFGALAILRHRFEARGARSFAPHLSLDTMPRVDWVTLERWCGAVRSALTC